MNIELEPWQTPKYILGKMPPRARQDFLNFENCPKWHISEVDLETLSKQCNLFRKRVFEAAEKKDEIVITESDLDSISEAVGMHPSGWDCVKPEELIKEIVKYYKNK